MRPSAPPPVRTWHAVAAALGTAALLLLAAPGILPWRAAAHLAWLSFVPLMLVLRRVPIRQAALLGLLTGLVFIGGLCPWFPALLARFANLDPLLAVVVTAAAVLYHALGWAAWAALVRATAPVVPVAIIAPAAFVAMERWMPMVFPYSLGLTQYQQLWAAQAAELGGPCVLSFLFVLVGAALAGSIEARRARRREPVAVSAIAAAAVLLAVLFGQLRLSSIAAARRAAPTLRVGVVQAGIVHTGWSTPPTDDDALARYQRVSAAFEQSHGPVDLLLWPEKAYPLLMRADAVRDYPPGHQRRVRRGFSSPLAFGLTTVEPTTRQVRNSVLFLGPRGRARVVYDKVHLIVYSEWLPAFMQGWIGGGKRYEPGRRLEPLQLEPASARTEAEGGADRFSPSAARPVPVSFFICFESSFPAHVRELVSRGALLLANLSDDSWFGDGVEPEQHLSQAVFRAIESRRDLIRATGSGISAHVSATGAILERTELNRSLLEANRSLALEPRLLTVDSAYRALGDVFAFCCAALALAALALARQRRRRRWLSSSAPATRPTSCGCSGQRLSAPRSSITQR